MPLYFSIVALIARKEATISAKGLLILCPMASKLFRELFGTLQKKSYICKQKQRYGHITKIDAYEENSDGSSCLHLHNDNSDGTVGSRRRFEVF